MLLEYDELIHLKGSEPVIAAIDEIMTLIEKTGAEPEKPSKLCFVGNTLYLDLSVSFSLPWNGSSGKKQNDSQENVQKFV